MLQPVCLSDLHILWFASQISFGIWFFDLFRVSYDLLVLQGFIHAIGAVSHGVVCCHWPSEMFLDALNGSGLCNLALVPQQVLRGHPVESQENPTAPSCAHFTGCISLWPFSRKLV